MNGRLKKVLSFLLICSLVAACLPMAAFAAPSKYELENKLIPDSQQPIDPSSLRDGELKTAVNLYTSDTLEDTDFTVELSALGQKFQSTTTAAQKYNIVFVLDVSSSMSVYDRFDNMITSANAAIRSLQDKNGDNARISLVSFSKTANIIENLTSERIALDKDTYQKYYNGGVWYYPIKLSSGTNIQAGLNCAYGVLNNVEDKDAIPVIILLSDGAPTYYYNDLSHFYTETHINPRTSIIQGNGRNATVINAAQTIAQAAYIKAILPSLQIYTIPFSLDAYDDSTFTVASATLEPTSGNLSYLYNFDREWNQIIRDRLPFGFDAGLMRKNYADACYPAENSTESLTRAMNSIIEEIQHKKPIRESKIDGNPDEASYLRMDYRLGAGFGLRPDTVKVELGGVEYEFLAGPDNIFTSESPEMSGIGIEYEGNTLTWLIPASVLPCNSPGSEGQVLSEPIMLTFTMAFDTQVVSEEGSYSTGECYVEYTPVKDDPYYYAVDGKYYAAIYPYPGNQGYDSKNNRPALTGFAVSDEESALNSSYIENPAEAAYFLDYEDKNSTTQYPSYYYGEPYDVYVDGRDRMRMGYGGSEISFEGATRYQARVFLTTLDKNDKTSYEITYFSDGRYDYSDASVSSVEAKPNGRAGITVTYDSGKRSIVFNDIFLSKNGVYRDTALNARFKRSFSYGRHELEMTELDGKSVKNYPIEANYKYGNQHTSYYDIRVTKDGTDYVFIDVAFSNYRDDTANRQGKIELYGAQPYQYYYYTETNDGFRTTGPYSNFDLDYNASSGKLHVTYNPGNIKDDYAEKDGYTIVPNNQNGYTVIKITSDGRTEVIEFYIEDGQLFKRTSRVIGQNGVDGDTGKVSYTDFTSGYLVFSEVMDPEEWAEECGAAVELSSTSRTPFALADSDGIAYIYLYFTVDKDFSAPEFTLVLDLDDNDDDNDNGFSSEMTELRKLESGTYTEIDLGALTNPDKMLDAGTYRIKYKLYGMNINPDVAHVPVTFSEMSFISEEYEALLKNNPLNSKHTVKISMTVTPGH